MITSIVRVSEKGQIAIPKEIREASKIKQGDDLIVFSHEGKIFLEKTETLAAKAAEEVKWIKHLGMLNLKKVWDNEKDAAWAEDLARRHRAGEFPVFGSSRRKTKTGARGLQR
jgi:AbrB family looped-hinge helix DNA binding protein